MKLAFYNAQAGRAAGSANGDLFDRAIEWRQSLSGSGDASKFVHVEFVFDEIRNRELPVGLTVQEGDANGSLCYSSSPRDGGVRFKWIDLTDGKWTLVELGTLDASGLQRSLVWCSDRVGWKYDWRAIFGFVFPWEGHAKRRRFCSESAVELMQTDVLFWRMARTVKRKVDPLVRWKTPPASLYLVVA